MPVLYNYTGSVDDLPDHIETDQGGLGILYPFGLNGTALKS